MNFKLLVFNEYWADEHNVPAIDCMTEEKFQKWLETPSGKLNENYEKEKKEELEYNERLKKIYNLKLEKKPVSEEDDKLFNTFNRRPNVIRVNSKIKTFFGNHDVDIYEDYDHLYLMKEFVEQGIVKVYSVSEDFYKTFHSANLSNLSFCNIFKL